MGHVRRSYQNSPLDATLTGLYLRRLPAAAADMVPASGNASLQSSASSYPSNHRQGMTSIALHHQKLCAGPKIMHAPRACRAHYRTQAAALSTILHIHLYCMFSLRPAFGACSIIRPRNRPHPDAHEQATTERLNTSSSSLLTRPLLARCTEVMSMERTRISGAEAGTVVMLTGDRGPRLFFSSKKTNCRSPD